MLEKNKQEIEKSEEEVGKKDCVTRLKEIGLKNVSNKTFINLENLTALLEKDFSKLNKTKALGFMQIIQREFDIDLSELKNEYLQFNNTKKKPIKNHQNTIFLDEKKPKKFLSYALLGIIAIVAAYFLLSNNRNSKDVSSVDLNVVKNDMVTEEAKESLLALDEVYEKETNNSDEVDLNKVVQEMFDTTEDNESNSSGLVDINESATILPATEENILLESNDTVVDTSEQSRVKPVEKVEKITIAPKVTKPKEVQNMNKGGLYIQPTRKAWVGVIFLDSMKKKDFLVRRPLVLDASKDQIILVGHKYFKIFNKQLELGFKSKQQGRFLYKDGELREISKKEYNRLRGNVRW